VPSNFNEEKSKRFAFAEFHPYVPSNLHYKPKKKKKKKKILVLLE